MIAHPIDTAPKDRPILVYGEMLGGEDWKYLGPMTWAVARWSKLHSSSFGVGGEGWAVIDHGQYYGNWVRATHWAELPEIPSPQSDGRKQ